MATACIPYRVVALVHFTGDSWWGHYACAISFEDSFGQLKWLHLDDSRSPQIWHEVPEWISLDITHVWLVRQDKFAGWHVPTGTALSEPLDHRARAFEQVLAH